MLANHNYTHPNVSNPPNMLKAHESTIDLPYSDPSKNLTISHTSAPQEPSVEGSRLLAPVRVDAGQVFKASRIQYGGVKWGKCFASLSHILQWGATSHSPRIS